MEHDLIKWGFSIERQKPIKVRYDGVVVDDNVAAFVIDDAIIISENRHWK